MVNVGKHESAGASGMGGAKGDFVASLGRKVGGLKNLVDGLRAEPANVELRDRLCARLQSLGTSATMMGLPAVDRALGAARARVAAVGSRETLETELLDEVARTLESLPRLAWGEEPGAASGTRIAAGDAAETFVDPSATPPPASASEPVAVHAALVVGENVLAQALLAPTAKRRAARFDVESTADAQAAYELARTLVPDVVVLDSDLDGAAELMEALLDDPLTEPIPIVVIGAFDEPGSEARFVAMGAAKTIGKPTRRDVLRAACEWVLLREAPPRAADALAGVSLQELGERLADTVRRALVEGVAPTARSAAVEAAPAAEVYGALWGAIAKIRSVVSDATAGRVRFRADGPEGAIPLCMSAAAEVPDAARARRTRNVDDDVKLTGRRVVVCDDDPGVVWYLADALRAAGCVVHEAHDGEEALRLAYRTSPDLVISDVVMPKLDGFGLCRAVKRDVALRDVPVVLLSWKEDLLQKLRDLGAGADGYVRKEAHAEIILARVREALRPRARVEARLAQGGEIRGRVDGLSVRTLLEIICATNPDCQVSIRDASCLYELEIRGGAPRRATRTAADGRFLRGPQAFTAMLGATAGRFLVLPCADAVDADLDGSLVDLCALPLARARAASALLSGTGMMRVASVRLDADDADDYVKVTMGHMREAVLALAAEKAPCELVLGGTTTAGDLDVLLTDLAARGAVRAIFDADGQELLGPEVDRFVEVTDVRAWERAPAALAEGEGSDTEVGASAYASLSQPVVLAARGEASAPLAPLASPQAGAPTPGLATGLDEEWPDLLAPARPIAGERSEAIRALDGLLAETAQASASAVPAPVAPARVGSVAAAVAAIDDGVDEDLQRFVHTASPSIPVVEGSVDPGRVHDLDEPGGYDRTPEPAVAGILEQDFASQAAAKSRRAWPWVAAIAGVAGVAAWTAVSAPPGVDVPRVAEGEGRVETTLSLPPELPSAADTPAKAEAPAPAPAKAELVAPKVEAPAKAPAPPAKVALPVAPAPAAVAPAPVAAAPVAAPVAVDVTEPLGNDVHPGPRTRSSTCVAP